MFTTLEPPYLLTRRRAGADEVFEVAARLVARLLESQQAVIGEAADLLGARLLSGGTVHVFGTGHSRAVAMELAGRTGGLSSMKELVLDDLVTAGWATKEDLLGGSLERRPEAAQALARRAEIGPADAFIVISHSGCNGAPVEMALEARRRGLPVVGITSMEHSRHVSSRHPSGLRLFEVADPSIDTCAPYADTAIRLSPKLLVCGVSSLAGILVAQALTVEIIGRYLEAGETPPLLVSRNLRAGGNVEER
ncbi:MAG TPA: sugar isomerase domain-containing protein [Acidimicrobiales bacterium]|nr:sugar isomerase domain-containing protein [Acidimicrobiales bacterium]